jgi:hypothetical protein
MKCPYRPYRVRLYQGEAYTTLWPPTVCLVLHGPLGAVKLDALVDPGADQTMLRREFAEALGITVDDGRPGNVRGISGSPIVVYPSEVELEIIHEADRFRWRAAVRFGPANHVLLGQIGCLEFFTATFDHRHRELTLEPNERYLGLA